MSKLMATLRKALPRRGRRGGRGWVPEMGFGPHVVTPGPLGPHRGGGGGIGSLSPAHVVT